jgi:hypothetical protein
VDVITIESLAPALSDNARAALVEADVIIGVDAQTQQEYTVFGTPPLESTVSFKKPTAMNVVRVGIDSKSGGLEALGALVSALKGRSDRPACAANS